MQWIGLYHISSLQLWHNHLDLRIEYKFDWIGIEFKRICEYWMGLIGVGVSIISAITVSYSGMYSMITTIAINAEFRIVMTIE